jgi:hypothetical protein
MLQTAVPKQRQGCGFLTRCTRLWLNSKARETAGDLAAHVRTEFCLLKA